MVEKILIFGESLIKKRKQNGKEYYDESLTGFSRVTNAISFYLADMGFDVDIVDYGIYEGSISVITPFTQKSIIKVYGIGDERDMYRDLGKYKLPNLLKIIKPGLLILIGDLRMYSYVVDIPNVPYTVAVLPVDGSPVPNTWLPILDKFDEIVSVSEFGMNELKKVGINSTLIPFGVDTNIYHPLSEDTISELKKTAEDLPVDKWIWGAVMRNQPRKNLPDLFLAFKKFDEIYPDKSILYVHSYPEDEIGWDLFELARYYRIATKVRFTKQFFDVSQPILNSIYNVADVNITATCSEGFGLTTLESMATGTPQIAPAHTAIAELVSPNCGELVKVERNIMGTALVNEYLVSIDDFVDKMVRMYENPGLRDWYARNALEKAKKYSWDSIIPKWVKLLEGF